MAPPAVGGLLLGLLFVVIWASAFNAARLVVLEWPALWALDLRFLAALPLLGLILLWRRPAMPSAGDAGRLALMGLFGTAGYLGCAWIALRGAPAGLVALLSATVPIFVAAGEVLVLRRRLAAQAWAGIALGWAGVALLGATRAWDGIAAAELGSLALALLGAVLQATGILCFAPARERMDPWVANGGQTLVAGSALLPVAMLLESAPAGLPSTGAMLALGWSILVVGLGGYALFFVMLRRLPASTAAALQLLCPPVAALLGWAFMAERLLPSDVAGGLVTLLGLALLLRARRP